MRKVTIYSTKNKAQQVIETNVNTWGELKQQINPEMGVSSSKCMCRENRTTLESNEAILPAGDITIFLYPEKVKSGAGKTVEDVYASFTTKRLQSTCARKSLSTTGTDSALRARIRKYDDRHGIDSTQEGAHLKKKSKKARRTTVGAVRGAGVKKPATNYPTATNEMEAVDMSEVPGTLDNEASQVANIDYNPKSEPLSPNSTISIHAVVKLMRNKFLNMFDDIEEQISAGTLASNETILADEAEALAKEAGFAISQEEETDY